MQYIEIISSEISFLPSGSNNKKSNNLSIKEKYFQLKIPGKRIYKLS